MATDEELRRRARQLLEKRGKDEAKDSVAPESEEERLVVTKTKRTLAEHAKGAVAPGAGVVGLIAIVTQLLSSRVAPEQMKALQERVSGLESDRTARRMVEFERDRIENCRTQQLDEYVRAILPRADSQVAPPPKPWFDRCPDMPEPTTGSTSAPKKQ